jgi:hypothetical protein
MSRMIKVGLIAAGALLGGLMGLVLGSFIGGNLMTDSVIGGLRGYEGLGLLGLAVGIAAGGVGGAVLTRRMK